MIIGDRPRELRETKNLSQGDIERRTGLLRCHISRVENGHTVPAMETLEKMAGGRSLIPRNAFGWPILRRSAYLVRFCIPVVSTGAARWSSLQKRLHVNSCLAKDRPECALGEIPGVMRDGDLSSCLGMAPDLMTAGALTVELKAESTKAAYSFAVRKSR